jgi:RHS repeat-associated protein
MRPVHALVLFLFTLFIVGNASAQDLSGLEQGIKPYGSYHGGDIDSISMVNGQLTLHIPLVSYPQRGGKLRMGFNVTYTNPYYQPWDNCQPPPKLCTQQNQAGYFLWYGSPGKTNAIAIVGDFSLGVGPEFVAGAPTELLDYFVTDYDSALHHMGNISANSWLSRDATGYNLNTATGVITDRSGVRYTAQIVNGFVVGWVTAMRDPSGNVITANLITNSNGTQSLQSWTDTIGRTIPSPPGMPGGTGGTPTTDFSGCTGTQATSKAALWTLPGPNGATAQYKICFASFPVSFQIIDPGCQSLGICQTTTGTNSQIQSIVLPNGTAWTFEFDLTGALAKIGFPTGGSTSYASTFNNRCTGVGQPHLNMIPYGRSATSRSVDANDGSGSHTWTYSSNSTATTVTDPLGNDSVHQMTALASCTNVYETEVDQYQGSHSGGTLLKKTITAYSHVPDPYYDVAPPLPPMNVVPVSVTTTDLLSGKVNQIVKTYDSGVPLSGFPGTNDIYGSLTSQKEYDFGSGAPGPLLRATNNSYLWQSNPSYSSVNILEIPCLVTVYGPGSVPTQTSCTPPPVQANQAAQTTYGYDESNGSPAGTLGNQTSVTRWLNGGTSPKSQTVFNTQGMPVQKIDAKLNTTIITYDSTGLFPQKIQYPTTSGILHSESFVYDINVGQPTSHTDQNSQLTSYTYDSMFRLTQVNHPDGGQEVIAFQETSTPFTATLTKKINSTLNQIRTNVFDGLGRVTQTQLSDPQGTVYTDTTYDALGQVHTVSNPHRNGTDPTGTPGLTTYGYDGIGRKTSETYPDSSVLATAYCGPSTLVKDPAGKWRRSRTDGLGHLVEVDEPNAVGATIAATGCPGTGEPIWVTSYSFDALGNMTGVLQNGSHQRTFTYDSLSRLLTSNNPESGTITYTYDTNGNVATKQDARAITATYAYDALNRVTSRTYSNGDPSITTTYDQANCLGLASCINIGQRTSVTDASGSEAWAFQVDKTNLRDLHVNQRTNTSGSLHITKSSTYILDLAGNLTQVTYPTGRVVNYTYDSANRPKTAADGANGITYATGPQTAPTGCLTGAVCYTPQGSFYALSIGQSSSFTGLNLTHSYNNRLQPLEFKASSTGGNAIDISYSFVDPTANKNAGHVFSITNNLDTTRSQSFSYDQVNRITAAQSASTFATSPAHCWGETYGLDPWGNLQSIVPTTNSSYTGCSEESGFSKLADPNNHLATFSYDASGNTANDSTIAYTWDGESQLKTAAGVTYSYDGDGRRSAKVGSKLYWYGSGGEILAETDGVGNTLNEYIFFGGQRITMLPINATPDGSIEQGLTYWTDGTPVQIVNDPAGAHSGNNYLQITTSAPGYTSHSRQFIPVTPGETITFGGWAYRTSGTTGAVRWKLAALDANQNSVASVNPTPSDVSSATWTDQVGTYTVPSGVAFVYLYAEIYLPTATTVARFDDGFVTTSPLYYVEDFLGSSRVTTRSNGVVCYDGDFYPYGGERPYTNGCLENNYKFEGKERDTETGNDDFGARYYSNRFGRWLSSDWSATPTPVPYANLTNPQTLNLYSMVSDDPESFADLDGHCCVLETAEAGAELGTIAGPIGEVIGAVGGAILGAFLGDKAADYVTSHPEVLSNMPQTDATDTGGLLGEKVGQQFARSMMEKHDAGREAGPGLPKLPTGKGSVPPDQRDPKRRYTKTEQQRKLDAQGGKCPGCGQNKTLDETQGHHKDKRHADGGRTDDANHGQLCIGCHKEVHKPREGGGVQ